MKAYWGLNINRVYPCRIIKFVSQEPWWKRIIHRISGDDVKIEYDSSIKEKPIQRWVPGNMIYFQEDIDKHNRDMEDLKKLGREIGKRLKL